MHFVPQANPKRKKLFMSIFVQGEERKMLAQMVLASEMIANIIGMNWDWDERNKRSRSHLQVKCIKVPP
jgi:hypothetical protein